MVKNLLIGFVLGATMIIPGLSAATMAVIFGVYDRLINTIVPNVKKILGSWKFWLPLLIGGAAGIFFASNVFTLLLENHHIPTYWFFIGVIAGGIPAIHLKTIETPAKPRKLKLPSPVAAICAAAAFVLMTALAVVSPGEENIYEEIYAYTNNGAPRLFGFLLLTGALGAIAMLIPGISGAFVLLVLGAYRIVLQAVTDMNIALLVPVILGGAAGLLLGAALVRFLFAKAQKATFGAVLGLVAGSIIVLFPGFGDGAGIIISLVCLLAGFAASFFFGRKGHSKPQH